MQYIRYPDPSNIVNISGASLTLGQKVMAQSLPVVVASDQTPIPVSIGGGTTVLETRYQDCDTANSGVNIQSNAGNFVEVGMAAGPYIPAAFANVINRLRVTAAFGEPLNFRLGANAAAAAGAPDLFIMNRGEQGVDLPVSIAIGDKIWVRSMTSVAVTDGILTMNFIGP